MAIPPPHEQWDVLLVGRRAESYGQARLGEHRSRHPERAAHPWPADQCSAGPRAYRGGRRGPETVANRFDLDIADVYHALAYYHDHPREMRAVEDEREAAFAALHESTRTANDRFGEEEMDEWLEHAVDEGDK